MLRALSAHPELQALQTQVEGAQAYARGAGAPPNPELQLAGVLGDPDEGANRLAQRLELGGQPGLRSDLAELEIQLARADLGAGRQRIALAAGSAYYELWKARAVLRLRNQRLELAQQLEGIALKRYQAEAIARNEYLRVQLETSQAQSDQLQAQGEERIAQARLNRLLGSSEDQVLELPALVPDLAASTLTLDQLIQQAQNRRPELKRAQLESESSQLRADLIRAGRVPDLEFSAYRGRLDQAEPQGLQLALIVPLWDWGSIRAQAEREEKQSQAQAFLLQARRQDVALEVRSAWERHQLADQRRVLLRDQAERALGLAEMAQKGYSAGYLTLTNVLETQQAYVQMQLDALTAETDFYRTRLELEAAAGLLMQGEDSP